MENNEFGKRYKEVWEKLCKENPRPVILVTGATGAGKSTLINLVIGHEIAKVGSGRPETQKMDIFQNDQLILYDSKGYETGEIAQDEFFREISAFLEEKALSPLTSVNIIWHCISAPAARVLDVDSKLFEEFKARGIPAAAILTQVDSADMDQINGLAKEVQKISSSIPIFWSTEDRDLQKELPNDKDMEKLYLWSLNNMEGTRRTAFRSACNRDFSKKRKKGRDAALAAATTAFGIGFIPMPVADAPALIAAQTAMLGGISYIYGA